MTNNDSKNFTVHDSIGELPILEKNISTHTRYLPNLKAEPSKIALLTFSRLDLLSIINDRNETRKEIKEKAEIEKKRIIDRWESDNRKMKKEKLNNFLKRLSNNERILKKDQLQIDINIMEHIQRTKQNQLEKTERIKNKFPLNDNKEYIMRKDEMQQNSIERRRGNYVNKIEKLEMVQKKRKFILDQRMQLCKEEREKKILRSKVKTILDKAFGSIYFKDSNGFEKSRIDIDDLLISKLTQSELTQVRLHFNIDNRRSILLYSVKRISSINTISK